MKLSFLSTLLFISFSSFAQIKKGAVSLGADIIFVGNAVEYTNPDNAKQNTSGALLSLTAGKAVKDNLFIGVGFVYNAAHQEYTSGSNVQKQDLSSIGGSAWVRKYYPVLKSFYLFVNGGVTVTGKSGEEKFDTGIATEQSGFTIQASLFPGISYQMHKNFFLDASINNLLSFTYDKKKYENKDSGGSIISASKRNSYAFATSVGSGTTPLQIGIRWIIANN